MRITSVRALFALFVPFAFAVPAYAAVAPVAPATCIDLPSSMGLGAHDTALSTNVAHLQAYLEAVGFLRGPVPGTFDAATKAAVQKFQAQSGVPATGYVGPLTRAALADRSCPLGFTFRGVNAPSTLAAGMQGTWVIGVTLPPGASTPVMSSALWGDEAMPGAAAPLSGGTVIHPRTAYFSFSHTYAAAGTYQPLFVLTYASDTPIRVRTQVTVK